MLIKIIKSVSGEVDGISLTGFAVDSTYEVGTTIGSYLLALGAAVPVIDGEPIYGIPNAPVSLSRPKRVRPTLRDRRKTPRKLR